MKNRPYLTSSRVIWIPLILSGFTHLWNPVGFPSIYVDENHYMRRAMEVIEGVGLQVAPISGEYQSYDHPFFGWIFLASMLKLVDYPNLLEPSLGELSSIQDLFLVPRALMGILALVDTFLIYKIAEHRYGRNVALIASVLFAVMPMTWLLRRILLDTILLPFLLSSIFLAIKYKESLNSNKKGESEVQLALFSGIFLGLAVITKIPAFTFIPLLLYLITMNGSYFRNWRRKLKAITILLVPIVLIAAIWPLYAIKYSQFDEFLEGIQSQSSRPPKPLFDPTVSIIEIDPILIILGTIGGIYATVRRDLLFLLWVIPYVLFFYFINYSQYIHIVLLFPVFCMTAGILLDTVSRKLTFLSEQNPNVRFSVRNDTKLKFQGHITDFLDMPLSEPHTTKKTNTQRTTKLSHSTNKISVIILSTVALFGLVYTTTLISIDINISFFEAYAAFVDYLPVQSDSNQQDTVTIMAPQKWSVYFLWIPKYIFDKDITLLKDGSKDPKTIKVITIGAESDAIAGELIVNKTIGKFSNEARTYNYTKYPYTNMRYNELADMLIKANY